MRSPWIVMLLALALTASACTRERSEPSLAVLEGQVEVDGPDGWQPATEIRQGQRLRATEQSVLQHGADEVTLGEGAELTIDARELQLSAGDVTVRGASTRIIVDDASVSPIGIVRVQGGVAPRVAVYTGTASITRPGETHRLTEFRQLILTSQRFDGTDDPLRYDAGDPVDQMHLMPAIAFDREVARYSATLTQQYGRSPQPPAFYASFTDLSEVESTALVEAAPVRDEAGGVGPPAEALVGLFVARAVAASAELGIRDAVDQVAELRREGARWGLIAMALRLEQVVFAATIDAAVDVREDFVASTGGAIAGAPSVSGGGGAPAPAPPPDPAPPQPDPPAPAPPPAPDPTQEPDPMPEVVPEGVGAIIDEVLDPGGDGLIGG